MKFLCGLDKETFYIRANETYIMHEIFTRGPVVATYDVYKDFNYYRKGIYIHKDGGRPTGSHAVKIIGWGKENDVPFWLIANSWNSDWGEDGYFRILRGANHCNIEGGVVTAEPRV
ncbi:hypothetical protein Y032_0643g1066 [Ancylostoma ceylanicum]|uniref:Peptidase C1A papain C-terminal domain-containing protein n=1 Tax=Ancylostoma ceylanicum TaxID=53326 RepID=A0A016WL27_9BILA|nr:hypothetical protein Y032_0643g1066 [Ancylostoma ceylanicum]